ncbi:MAG TPA: DUF6069 family protein [Nocardioidaceae bacterium]|nr:DUF6069 family protein [Nocardioidaceae bacterium]
MSYPSAAGRPPKTQVSVEAARFWGGGFATACVAALVAVAGVLICQDVLDLDLVRPALLLEVADSFAGDYALTAFLLALAATGLAHGLALTTPRPRVFFGWIIALATVCGAVAPFAIGDELESQIATAGLNAVLGLCIGSLIGSVMSRAVYTTTLPPIP